jgi:hypothetical protein
MSYRRRRVRVAAVTLALLLCGVTLGACGGSSTSSSAGSAASSSTGAATSPITTAPSPKSVAAAEAVLAGYRACLKKYGVNLPKSKVGEKIKQPTTGTPAQYEAAGRKCRSLLGTGTGTGTGAGVPETHGVSHHTPVTSARLAQFTRFVSCMGENGVKLPKPKKSTPLFVPPTVNVNSSQYKAAEIKCLPLLAGH